MLRSDKASRWVTRSLKATRASARAPGGISTPVKPRRSAAGDCPNGYDHRAFVGAHPDNASPRVGKNQNIFRLMIRSLCGAGCQDTVLNSDFSVPACSHRTRSAVCCWRAAVSALTRYRSWLDDGRDSWQSPLRVWPHRFSQQGNTFTGDG